MLTTRLALMLLVHLVVFAGIGQFVARLLGSRESHPDPDRPMHVWLMSALVGYVVFWLYFLDHRAGLIASLVACGVGIYDAGRTLRGWIGTGGIPAAPVGWLVPAVALFYLGILTLVPTGAAPLHMAAVRFMDHVPLDCLIPSIFADRLWEGSDPRRFPNTWLSSDRPPLQAGILLVQRPLAVAFGNIEGSDLVLGMVAQLAWIPAVWSLLGVTRSTRRQAAIVLAFCIGSGFFLVNTVFVWPKLLAGAFGVAAIGEFLRARAEERRLTRSEWLAAGLFAALAILSHTGVAFAFIGVALVLPLFRTQFDAKGCGIACLTGALLLLPWFVYQKVYEPPANRLMKWHLAGQEELDDRSLVETLKVSYGELTAAEVARNKLLNARQLLGHANAVFPTGVRLREFRNLLPSLGILNLGIVLLVARWRRENVTVRRIAVIVIASTTAWLLLLFGPDAGIVIVASYAVLILLWVIAASAVAEVGDRFAIGALALQLGLFAAVWLTPVAADGVWRPAAGLRAAGVAAAVVGGASVFVALRTIWTGTGDVAGRQA